MKVYSQDYLHKQKSKESIIGWGADNRDMNIRIKVI